MGFFGGSSKIDDFREIHPDPLHFRQHSKLTSSSIIFGIEKIDADPMFCTIYCVSIYLTCLTALFGCFYALSFCLFEF